MKTVSSPGVKKISCCPISGSVNERELAIVIEKRCCGKCIICDAHRLPNVDCRPADYLERLEDFIDFFRPTKALVTGGEPLLAGALFFKVCDMLESRNIQYSISTNGIMLDRLTGQRLKGYQHLDHLNLSLDSRQSDINDIQRGKGAYEKAIYAIALLENKLLIPYDIQITVTKLNISTLSKTITDLLNNQNMRRLKIVKIAPYNQRSMRLAITPFMEPTLVDSFEKYSVDPRISFRRIAVPGFPLTRCNIDSKSLTITPEMDIFLCPWAIDMDSLYAGNAIKNDYATILRKADRIAETVQYGRSLNAQCFECEKLTVCGLGCPVVSLQQGLSGGPEFCQNMRNAG